jgi:transposase
MLDVSKETNIAFLRAGMKLLQEKLLKRELELLELRKLKAESEEICRSLSSELLILRKKFFSGGREKSKDTPPKTRIDETNLPHNQSPIDIEQESQHELDSSEELFSLKNDEMGCNCGGVFEPMQSATEDSIDVTVVERKYILRKSKRQKYLCSSCKKFKTAEGPAKAIPSSNFAAEMAVQVVDDKFNLHMPLERQCREMKDAGLTVDSKTLYNLTSYVASNLEKIPAMIQGEILSRPTVCIDETPMELIGTDTNGYVWAICNNHGVYYQYETTRSGKVARELLKDFSGNVMCDGFSGYNWIENADGLVLCACWAHVRRKFYDAIPEFPGAQKIVERIDELFKVEHEAKDFEETREVRKKKSSKLLIAIESRIRKAENKSLGTSAMGKAINYYESQKSFLMRFLEDPTIPLSNNAAERQLRSPVLGRKSFQGFRTINGADVGMVCYTIINTCKLLGLIPKAYLMEMMLRVHRGVELETPLRYGQRLQAAAAKEVEATLQAEGLSP